MFSTQNDKGNFLTLQSLKAKYPFWQKGWYATVIEIVYAWDEQEKEWVSRTWIALSSSDSDRLWGELPNYYLNEANHTRNIASYTINTLLTSTNRVVQVDCTSWDITITLPTAVWFTWMLDIVKIDSSWNSVIVTPQWGQTISWETTQEIFWQYDNMTIYSDGSNWLIH